MSDSERFVADRYQIGFSVFPCVRDLRLGTCAIWPPGSDESMAEIAAWLNADPTLSFKFQWRKYFEGSKA